MTDEATEKSICETFRLLRAYRVAGSITFHLNSDGMPVKQELKTTNGVDSVICILRAKV